LIGITANFFIDRSKIIVSNGSHIRVSTYMIKYCFEFSKPGDGVFLCVGSSRGSSRQFFLMSKIF
jgi:hypothetical protein